ncbi:hypothetical protein HDU84_000165 [Entophlyctis sp. JEL0112]|nr:hypothetical protein HDU84_000165 [Entophlyctis sp. JEL0112]
MGDMQIRRQLVVRTTREVFEMQILRAFLLVLAMMLVFALFFAYFEGWSVWDGFYFTFIALTTIGFGDLSPKTPLTRSLFVWFVFFGIAAVTNLGSLVSERLLNEWIVTVGLIENRMGRYEVKARIKREWGVGAISNDGDVDVGSSAAAGRLSGVLPTHPRSAAIPRIVRITSPQYGRSAPSHLLQRRSLDLLHSDDEEEFSDPERTDESDDENVDFNSHAVGGQGLVSSPTREDEVRSRGQSSGQTPFLGRVRPMSMRVFPKRRSFLG